MNFDYESTSEQQKKFWAGFLCVCLGERGGGGEGGGAGKLILINNPNVKKIGGGRGEGLGERGKLIF